ncbi:MAG: esterase [Bacteroidota bacterium]
MKTVEKKVSYTTVNSYSVLNKLTSKTKNVWFVCHGIGYLSRYFLKYFNELPPEENYIIAPQAASKYYLNGEYKHVGASWLTKENTMEELHNVLTYLDTVYKHENIPDHCNFIVFGYSQGVSIAARWVAKRKVDCHRLVLHSGGIPHELVEDDFTFLRDNHTEVDIIIGDKDPYLTPERIQAESKKIENLFQGRAKQLIFDGGHEIKKEIINQLV